MAKLIDVQRKIRKSKKWGFLAEMVGETNHGEATAGVSLQNGLCLVNPNLASLMSTEVLVERVRGDFAEAQRERAEG